MRKILKSPVFWIIAIIFTWLLAGLITYYYAPEGQYGPIGDMFGSVNALFSGLALAGVVYAIILQKEELKLQREELKLTREELARSAEAQEKAYETMKEQLGMQKEVEIARKISIKPLLHWRVYEESGHPDNTLFGLTTEYLPKECPKIKAHHLSGVCSGFNSGVGKIDERFRLNIRFRMKKTDIIRCLIDYTDKEGKPYNDLLTFNPSAPKSETILSQPLDEKLLSESEIKVLAEIATGSLS